jgi:hypothetical protein
VSVWLARELRPINSSNLVATALEGDELGEIVPFPPARRNLVMLIATKTSRDTECHVVLDFSG